MVRHGFRLLTEPHRIRAWIFYATHPSYPLFTPAATAFLADYLKPGMNVFEWGMGRSTPFFAKRGVKLISIEHDKMWYRKVRAQINATGLSENVELRLVVVDSSEQQPDYGPYLQVISEYLDNFFDVVVVDGRERAACFLQAVTKVKPGGLLIMDDSQRERYAEAMKVVENAGWIPDHLTFGFNRTSVWVKPSRQ